MGGRKQKKKINLDWTAKEASVSSNQSVTARNLRKTDLGAVIFGTTHHTISECLSRQLFGLPEGHYSYIKNIKPGLVLFLFNYSDRKLHGIFEAAGHGQLNIDQYAWVADGDDTGYTRYPAQVKICVRKLCHPLSEDQFQPIIAPNYYDSSKHFHFELDHDQTKKLMSLFTLSPVNSSISTKWSNLYASLPGNSKRQEYNAHVSLNHTLPPPKNLNQTSTVSYASTLSRTTINASSSQPTGKWSALFKPELGSETFNDGHYGKENRLVATTANEFTCGQTWEAGSSPLANTTREELPFNQEYEDRGAFLRANSWEGSNWDDINTNEVEWDQTWESDLNAQANPEADKANFVQENTWEESHITATCEVENAQTSNLSDQNIVKLPSSPQRPYDNLDSNTSLSSETSDGGVKENHEKDNSFIPNTVVETTTNLQPLVIKLMQEFEVMKGSQLRLEQELDTSKQEILQLRNRVSVLESGSRSIVGHADVDNQQPSKFLAKFTDSVLIVGGHDGSSWLPNLDSYFPSKDIKVSLSPMNVIKSYASAAIMNGELYHFGGDGSHTVESFNPANNQWTPRPPLIWKNINVGGASVKDKLFVVGGATESHCSSEVEYLDLNIGKWLPSRSMHSKRLAPAAVDLNNILYVSGGYDGVSYLSSVERFDPREGVWCKISNMNARKGCHSMVVLNEKLYTIGGFSGDEYLATVEYLDTRMGAWVEAEPMNVSRGNFGAFVMGGKMYTVGGRKDNDGVLDIVECYKEGSCWEVAVDMKAIGKRSHFSAFVM